MSIVSDVEKARIRLQETMHREKREALARDAFNALINRNVMLPGAEGLRHAEAIARAAYMAADAMIAESEKS